VAVLWFKIENGQIASTTAKYLENEYLEISKAFEMKEGDVVILAAHDNRERLNEALGALRLKIGKEHFKVEGFDALWIVDFPFLEWSEEENRFVARHHPIHNAIRRRLRKRGGTFKNPSTCVRYGYKRI